MAGNYNTIYKSVVSDHFDSIKQPLSVSLGLHLKKQTVEDVVNLLRRGGIHALPFYDENIKDDLSCFVVEGSGIRTPFFKTAKDAMLATKDMVRILSENGFETSCAMPVVKDNLIEATSQRYADYIIDIEKNNPEEKNVHQILSEFLKYAADKMPNVVISQEGDKEFTSQKYIYRGGLLGDKPYAIASSRRSRDCVYATNRLSEAVKYSKASNLGKGLRYQTIDGMQYGFVYEFKQQKGQKFYDMAGAERPFASALKKHTAYQKDYRADYETLVLKDRNPLSAIYLRVDDKLVQIADAKGYFKKEGIDFEKFAKLHTPKNTSELNDYLIERNNKQIKDFPTFEYKKESQKRLGIFKKNQSLEVYNKDLNVRGLCRSDQIEPTSNFLEIKDASFHSIVISEKFRDVHLKGDMMLYNCTLSPDFDALDASNCGGNVCVANMEYVGIKAPKECESFTLSEVKIPPMKILDLNDMKCKKMILEDVDLSEAQMVKLPQHIEELRLKYNVKFPKNIDFSGAKKIVFDKRAKPDYAQTTAMTVSPSTKIEVENIQDKELLQTQIQNKNVEILCRNTELPLSLKIMQKSGRGALQNPIFSDSNDCNQNQSKVDFDEYGRIKNQNQKQKNKTTYQIASDATLNLVLDEQNKTCQILCEGKLYPLFDEKNGLAEFVDQQGNLMHYDKRISIKPGQEPIVEIVNGRELIKFGPNHEYKIPFASENGEYYTQMKYETGETINIPFPSNKAFEKEDACFQQNNQKQQEVWIAKMRGVLNKYSKE